MTAEIAPYLERYQQRFQPVGQREFELVKSMAQTEWRLARIPAFEESLFARGQLEFADHFADCEIDQRVALIQAQTYLAYQKQFRLLTRQELQLRRRQGRDEIQLGKLQQQRWAAQPASGQRTKLFLVPRKKT